MSETIVFFGSGPVAAESLALLAEDFEIEAVITKPRPAHHKGEVPVLSLASELGLKTFTTADKQAVLELFKGRSLQSRLGIVIDFGIIIPQEVIDYFPLGIVNSHFSLLPRWRGADPISFAVLSGDQQTGVSLMQIVPALDEGPLLSQRSLNIAPDETTPTLTSKLITLSHQLLVETLPSYIEGSLQLTPQAGEAVYSRKLEKADSKLDFNKPAAQLEREIRAFTGWPRSRTTLGSTDVIITKAHIQAGSGEAGSLWLDGGQLGINTNEGILVIDSLIPAGKKEMPASAFLLGYKNL